MRHARDEFAKVLAKTPFRDPSVPVVGNVHANMIRTADGLRDELSEHLVHGVQWVATVRNMAAIGVTDFVEIGPGRVLTGLVKRISPESNAHALDEADDGWLPAPSPAAAPKRPKRKP
jgi:malonyl CoA-acyl carrier protein transacylase